MINRCTCCSRLLDVEMSPLAPDLHLPTDNAGRCPMCALLDGEHCTGCGVHRYRFEREDGPCEMCAATETIAVDAMKEAA